MRPNLLLNAAHLYRLRVREQPLQELLAMLGIAAGVALLFAVQVASTSITGTVRQLTKGITGNATLEVAARGPDGMDQAIVAKAAKLPSVKVAAPVIQQRVTVVGPAGSAALTLVGVDERLKKTGGPLVHRYTQQQGDLESLGLFLTEPTAKAIGVRKGQRLTIQSGAESRELPLAGTMGANEIGQLEKSPMAIAPLGLAQRISNMPGRISRVLIEPKAGREAQATKELQTIAEDKLNVRASDTEADLLGQALKPDQQSSIVFSAIAVAIGMLFAFNAMLLAMAWRWRFVAFLRMVGADRSTIVAMLVFEALVLGIAASLVGLVLGDLLSRIAFQSVPTYLETGFSIGSQRVVEAKTIMLSVVGGLTAALLASAKPALDTFRVDPAEAVHEQVATARQHAAFGGSKAFWAGLAVILVSSIAAFLTPWLSLVGILGVIGGLVLVLGPALRFVLARLKKSTRVRGGIGFALAVDELSGTPARATALAVIAASAMAALVSIGGARMDLQRGIDQLLRDVFGTTDVWVFPGGEANVYGTEAFDPQVALGRLRRQTDIRSVTIYGGSFLDLGQRRVRILARSSSDPIMISRNQILDGNVDLATKRLRSGGWVALTDSIASELGNKKPGDDVVIPTPSGNRRFRLAATTANYGWPSGNIVMNHDDYAAAWGKSTAGALVVRFAPGVSPVVGKQTVRRALGSDLPLNVETADDAIEARSRAVSQGLARLRQISILVLGAAMLAIVAAMFAAVWQRRIKLASLRAIGMYRSELYRALFSETTLIVFLGGLAGLVFGLFCQIFASRWIAVTSGYQAPFEPAIGFGLVTLAQATLLALLATAGPAFLASRVAPSAGEAT